MSSIMREDWIEVEIGEIANIYNGNSINAQVKEKKYKNLKEGYNYIGTKDVGFDAVVDYENGVKIPFEEETFKIAPKGCVLVCSEGGSAGRKTAYIEQDVCFGNKLYAITDLYNVLVGKYVFNYSRFRKFFDDFKNQMNGIIGGVSSNKFAEILFPLAPLPIQRAIVSKIEALFSDLDNGIANFKKAQAQLKIYRQAVLKKAFEGGFTITNEELRITDSKLNDELRITDSKLNDELRITDSKLNDELRITDSKLNDELRITNEEDNLPKGWRWVKLGKVGKIITGNTPSKSKIEYYDTNDFPFFKPTDLEQGINVNWAIDNVSKLGFIEGRSVPIDSILVTCIGATIGKTGLIKKEGIFNQQINAIVPNTDFEAKFVYYQVISSSFQEQIKTNASSTTLPILNKTKFSDLSFIKCSLAEQTQIVQEIESRLSVTDNLEFVIRNSIEKAEALRQSILKKAFEGKLLSEAEIAQCKQAADYEPASELLKKITNEKLRITNEKKSKKRGTRNS